MYSHRAKVSKSNLFLGGGNGLVKDQLLSLGFLIHSFNMESGIRKNQQPKTGLHIHGHAPFSTPIDLKEVPTVLCVCGYRNVHRSSESTN